MEAARSECSEGKGDARWRVIIAMLLAVGAAFGWVPGIEANVVVGTATDVAGTDYLAGIACPTSSTCFAVGISTFDPAVGFRGVAVTFTNGVAGATARVDGTASLHAIACPTATTCYAAGGSSPVAGPVVTIVDGVPGAPKYAGGDIFVLWGIACPTTTACYAVGESEAEFGGVVVPITSGTPGSPQFVPNVQLFDVACPSTSTCYAVGENDSGQGVVAIISGGTVDVVTAPAPIDQLNGITCRGTTCFAVGTAPDIGHSVIVPIANGAFGTPSDSNVAYEKVACVDGGICLATSDASVLTQISNGVAGTSELVSGPTFVGLLDVACPTDTVCLVVGERVIPDAGPLAQGIVAMVALDTTPPSLTLPGDITMDATGPAGASVTYAASASDPDDSLTPACAPASGTVFPIGATTVQCSVVDAGGNTASGSFTVTIEGAAQQLSDLVGTASAAGGPGSSLVSKLQVVQAHLSSGNTTLACASLVAFINEVEAQSGKKLTTSQAAMLIASANLIRAVIGC